MASSPNLLIDRKGEHLEGRVAGRKIDERLPGVPDYADETEHGHEGRLVVSTRTYETVLNEKGGGASATMLHIDERIQNSIKHSFAELRSSLEGVLRDCLREEFQSFYAHRTTAKEASIYSGNDSDRVFPRQLSGDTLQEPDGAPPELIDHVGNGSGKESARLTLQIPIKKHSKGGFAGEADTTAKLPVVPTSTPISSKAPSTKSCESHVIAHLSSHAKAVSRPSRISISDLQQQVRQSIFMATLRRLPSDPDEYEDDEDGNEDDVKHVKFENDDDLEGRAEASFRTQYTKLTIAGLRKTFQATQLKRNSHHNSLIRFHCNESFRQIVLQVALALALILGVILHLGEVFGAWSMHVTQLERQGYLILSVGALASFILFQASPQCKHLLSANGTLAAYAGQWELTKDWRGMIEYSLSLVGLWLLTLLCHPALQPIRSLFKNLEGEASGGHNNAPADFCIICWASFVCIAAASGFILALTHHLLHVSLILALGIDSWCVDFFETLDVDSSFSSWNILQMLMRDSSEAVSSCVYGLLAWLALSSLLTASEAFFGTYSAFDFAVWLLPHAAMGASVMVFFLKAADISWKCARVPSLIISLPLDVAQRQHLVDYIVSSDAGFFLGEVKLSPVMIAKASYVIAILVFALTKHQMSGRAPDMR